MITIETIQNEMLEGSLAPKTMAEYRVQLSGYYSQTSSALEVILFEKPGKWMDMRKENKSDSSTDKAWDATEEGKREMVYRFQLKRIEKMMSSLNSALRVAENEAKNLM